LSVRQTSLAAFSLEPRAAGSGQIAAAGVINVLQTLDPVIQALIATMFAWAAPA
jgi:hypothetical protein